MIRFRELYYVPFDTEIPTPTTKDSIRNPGWLLHKEVFPQTRQEDLMAYLTAKGNRCCPGRLDDRDVRLRINFEDSSGILLADGKGCVNFSNQSFYLIPGAFFHAYIILEEYKILTRVRLRRKNGRG